MIRSFLLCLFFPAALGANTIFNGSFELGTDGFALEKYLRTDTNPELKFLPLKTAAGAPGEGRQSLQIENPFAEHFYLYSKEFRLKPSTRYRLSAKMKSSTGGESLRFAIGKVDPKWTFLGKTIRLTKEWSTYECIFTTDARGGFHHLSIRPSRRDKEIASDIFIDGLRIDRADAPESDVPEAVVEIGQSLYLRGESAEMTLKAFNPSGETYTGQVVVTGRDEYTGKVLFSERRSLSLNPGEVKRIPLGGWKLERYGGIRITLSAPGLKTHDTFFSVIGKYEAKPFDIHRDFVVAFNGGLAYQILPQTEHPAYLVYNAPFEKRFELLAKAGCRILRDHDGGVRGVDWPSVEWVRDKFDFTHLDRQINLYEKYGITLFPVIGNGFSDQFEKHRPQQKPLWAEGLCTRLKKNPPNVMPKLQGHILLPPVELYHKYIYRTVEHLKGRVPVYEIVNEPNLFLGPDVYLRYLKAAHDAIRKADPAAKISGFCLTSDYGASATPWMKACVKGGGLKYVDAVSFHPYRGRELGAARPADAYIADLRSEMKSYGVPEMPLWNTELYFLIDQDVKHNAYEETLCQPHHVVWRFLVDLGEGSVQSIAIPGNYLWKKMLTPNMKANSNFHELIPSENFVAYNALARLFEGAKTVKKIRYPHGIICYAYRKNGKMIAAIWNYLKKPGVSGDLSGFHVMDLFGNPEPSGVKTIGIAPFYLTADSCSEEEFLQKLEQLPLRLEQPISTGQLARLAGNTLYVMLHNDSGKEQTGVAGVANGGFAAREPVPFTLPIGGHLPLAIPVKRIPDNGKTPELLIWNKSSMLHFPLEIVENKLINKEFRMKNAKGTISFTKDQIHLSMIVRDSSNSGPSGSRPFWENDCVELFFDTDPLYLPPRHAQVYTPQTFRLFVLPRDTEKLHADGSSVKAEECQLDLKQLPDGYSFTLTIPVRTGPLLGFDVKINDRDGTKKTETQLGNGLRLFRNRCSFSLVK